MNNIISENLSGVPGSHQKLTAVDVIESWNLPYHLSWVVKYISQGNDIRKFLKKMEWHLCCELTSSWRRQYYPDETTISLERVINDWDLPANMRTILSHIKACEFMSSEKGNLIQAIQHLQEEIQLHEKDNDEQENDHV